MVSRRHIYWVLKVNKEEKVTLFSEKKDRERLLQLLFFFGPATRKCGTLTLHFLFFHQGIFWVSFVVQNWFMMFVIKRKPPNFFAFLVSNNSHRDGVGCIALKTSFFPYVFCRSCEEDFLLELRKMNKTQFEIVIDYLFVVLFWIFLSIKVAFSLQEGRLNFWWSWSTSFYCQLKRWHRNTQQWQTCVEQIFKELTCHDSVEISQNCLKRPRSLL